MPAAIPALFRRVVPHFVHVIFHFFVTSKNLKVDFSVAFDPRVTGYPYDDHVFFPLKLV